MKDDSEVKFDCAIEKIDYSVSVCGLVCVWSGVCTAWQKLQKSGVRVKFMSYNSLELI